MKRSELEQLISEYIDNELSPQHREKVEGFIRTNAQAKQIYDEYIEIRSSIQNEMRISQQSLPANFGQIVLQSIDRAEAATSKTVSTSLRKPLYAYANRLKNPRLFAYPLAVLVVALIVGVFYRVEEPVGNHNPNAQIAKETQLHGDSFDSVRSDNLNSSTEIVASENPNDAKAKEDKEDSEKTWEQQIVRAPMSNNQQLKSDKSTEKAPSDFQITCQIKDAALKNTLLPKLFLKEGVAWKQSTDGSSAVVYEIKVGRAKFDTLLQNLSENESQSVEIALDAGLERFLKTEQKTNDSLITVRFLVVTAAK